MKQFCLGIIVAIGLTLPAFGQGVDPLLGAWKLNVEKSTSTIPLHTPADAKLDTLPLIKGTPSLMTLRH